MYFKTLTKLPFVESFSWKCSKTSNKLALKSLKDVYNWGGKKFKVFGKQNAVVYS